MWGQQRSDACENVLTHKETILCRTSAILLVFKLLLWSCRILKKSLFSVMALTHHKLSACGASCFWSLILSLLVLKLKILNFFAFISWIHFVLKLNQVNETFEPAFWSTCIHFNWWSWWGPGELLLWLCDYPIVLNFHVCMDLFPYYVDYFSHMFQHSLFVAYCDHEYISVFNSELHHTSNEFFSWRCPSCHLNGFPVFFMVLCYDFFFFNLSPRYTLFIILNIVETLLT